MCLQQFLENLHICLQHAAAYPAKVAPYLHVVVQQSSNQDLQRFFFFEWIACPASRSMGMECAFEAQGG